MNTVDAFEIWDNNDFRRYKKLNNFSKGLAVELGSDEVKDAMVSVSEEGKVYDNTKFVKMYHGGVVALGGLVVSSKLMFCVFERMLLDGNMVELNPSSVLLKCGYSVSSRTIYYRMLNELLDKCILKKISGGRYMVNPNMFYYGNRVKDMGAEISDYFRRKK
jgi:hypothetical protein